MWPDSAPSDESLRAYLIRRGFNQNAVGQAVSIFRDALGLVEAASDVSESDDEAFDEAEDGSAMQTPPPNPVRQPANLIGKPIVFDMESVSGQYSFDNADDLAEFIDKLERLKPLLPNKG